MIKSYLKIAFRNLLRDRNTTLINVIGLGVSICIAIVIFAILSFEFTYDHHHEDAESIYRLVRHDLYPDGEDMSGGAKFPLPGALRKDFPDQVDVTATYFLHDPVLMVVDSSSGEAVRNKYTIDGETALVDSVFPNVFTFNFLSGEDPAQALAKPNTAYLSVSRAETIFGSTDITGKTLKLNGDINLTVAGVFEDPPKNTMLPVTVMISYPTLNQLVPQSTLENWNNIHSAHNAYVKLKNNVSAKDFHAMLDGYERQYNDDEIESVYYLQPLTDVHFDDNYSTNSRTMPLEFHYAVLLIAVLLIVAASINYINLATAQAVRRSREVGIRKVLGSNKMNLALQFLGETAIVTFGAVIVGLAGSEILLPYFADVLGIEISESAVLSPEIYLFLFILFVGVTLLSGAYPAGVISGYQPVQAIRNRISAKYGKGFSLRKTLVVTQFVISQAMIIATLVVVQQMDYMMESDLGFKKEAIAFFPIPENDSLHIDRLNNQLQRYAETSDYSIAFTPPASGWGMSSGVDIYRGNDKVNVRTKLIPIDKRFIDLYDIELLNGRNIRDTDGTYDLIVNEAALGPMNLGTPEEAVGKTLSMWDSTATIIGVVKDFHSQSLENEIQPTILFHYNTSFHSVSVKMAGADYHRAIERMEDIFNELFPNYVFEYHFLDETIAEFYQGQQRMMKLMTIFAVVAVLIGALGLFGLISFLTATKTKEIGIRKALGATIHNILFSISYEFVLLLGIALLIAVPLSYFLMDEWLTMHAYRISIGIDVYLITVGISLLVAAATIGWKAYRAASLNPVKSLRYE